MCTIHGLAHSVYPCELQWDMVSPEPKRTQRALRMPPKGVRLNVLQRNRTIDINRLGETADKLGFGVRAIAEFLAVR